MILLEEKSKELGLTQAEIARRTGLHNTTVSNIFNERSKAWPGQAERIKQVLRDAGWNGEGDLFATVEVVE